MQVVHLGRKAGGRREDDACRAGLASLRNPLALGAALAWLPGLLLHVARREAGRRNRWLRLSGRDLDGLARQAAAGALEAITVRLDTFRGQST